MNSVFSNASNTISVSALPVESVLHVIEKYKEEKGFVFNSLSKAFGFGCTMAKFFIPNSDVPVANNVEEIEAIYERFRNTVFVDVNLTVIPVGSTIGMLDLVNERFLFIVVVGPGLNIVYYQRSVDDAPVSEIGLLASDAIRRAARMEPYWKDGNNYDKVLTAELFGFPYDKKDDEIIVPDGITENAYELSMLVAKETHEEVKSKLESFR